MADDCWDGGGGTTRRKHPAEVFVRGEAQHGHLTDTEARQGDSVEARSGREAAWDKTVAQISLRGRSPD